MGLLLVITAINTITNDSIKWCRSCVISDSNLAGYGVQAIKRPIKQDIAVLLSQSLSLELTDINVQDGSVF